MPEIKVRSVDAIEIFTQQRRRIDAMFEEYEGLDDKAPGIKLHLFQEVAATLRIHAALVNLFLEHVLENGETWQARATAYGLMKDQRVIDACLSEVMFTSPGATFDARIRSLRVRVGRNGLTEIDKLSGLSEALSLGAREAISARLATRKRQLELE